MAEVKIQEGESIESALRRFKRKVQQEDIIKDIKKHSFYLKPGDKRRAKLIRDILTYHASPTEAAEIANEAKVETLVFTHMVPPLNPPVTEQMFLRGVADIFKGKVVLAKDGLRFDLPSQYRDR